MAGKIRITSTAFPSGDNKTIQYNNDGYFGGATQLFWDKVNDRLGLGTSTPDLRLDISSGIGINLTPALQLTKPVNGNGSATGIILRAASDGSAKGGIFFEQKGIGYGRGNLHFALNNDADASEVALADTAVTINYLGKVGVNTSTLNETLSVGGAIRLGTSALTNAGTIRWNGANFQGYKGGAWVNLDSSGGLWTDAGTYYRPNNVVNSGNTGFRICDAGYSLLGQVSPTTGSIFGGGSTDGTVLKINHGNSGSPTANANPPLWVKRYYNYAGATWNAGAAYFGAVKTAGEGSLYTVQIDTHCSGGTVPAAGGVLSCLLSHLKNDSVVGSQQDIHNMQIITYMPINAYSSIHAAVMVDLNNRRASEGWLDDYVDKWSCGIRVANESALAYHNSCAYSTGSAAGGGKWYIGLGLTGIAYDSSLNKGEGVFFKVGSFDNYVDCLRSDGKLTIRAENNLELYYGAWTIWRTGRQNSYTDRMHLTGAGNLVVAGTIEANSGLGANLNMNSKQINGTGTIELTGAKIKSDALLLNARSSTPTTTWTNGLIYYDTSTNQLRIYKNGSWKEITTN